MHTDEKTVLVCPGMGPIDRATILRQLLITPLGRAVRDEAIAVLRQDPCDQWGPDDSNYSPAAQACFFLSTLALARQLRADLGRDPELLVAPSFGVRAVTVVSGGLSVVDGMKLNAGMTTVMEEWFASSQSDLVTQSFARLPERPREELLERLRSEGHYAEVSCLVDHDLLLITVSQDAQGELVSRGREVGAMPLYTMKPPMHASCLHGLRDKIEERVLTKLEFSDPRIPIVSDIDGSIITTGDAIRKLLLLGIDHMVNWPKACATLETQSIDRLWVAGQDGLFTRSPTVTHRWPVRQLSAAHLIDPVAYGSPLRM